MYFTTIFKNNFYGIRLGNPMDRGAWEATVHGVAKELDMTVTKRQQQTTITKRKKIKKIK